MPIRILIYMTALLSYCLMGNAAHALDVKSVRLGTHPDKIRLVFELSEAADFRVFTLDDPNRLVVDLPAFNWRAESFSNAPQSGIKGLRHGHLEKNISRIVFDMHNPLGIKTAFMIPRQDGKPDRLVVDLVETNQINFTRSKNDIFGNLVSSGGVLNIPPPVDDYNHSINHTREIAAVGQTPVPKRKPEGSTEPYTLAPAGPKPLIVIDPGHGGVDPGAIGANGLHEKNVVLSLGKALKKELEASGRYRVIMTRESDIFIKLADRVKFARDHGADLFVSIHADSLPRPNVRGTSIYTLSDKASDEQTEKLAARENKADLIAGLDLSVEDQDVANILVNLAMRDTMNQSKFFANTVVSTFETGGMRLLERPHRYAGFAVLKAPDIPSVLIEAGFMSNKQEANMLFTAEYQKKFAVSLTKSLNAYFNTVSQNELN
jgi:N-acetylmuramoyl-L-alanine amidase